MGGKSTLYVPDPPTAGPSDVTRDAGPSDVTQDASLPTTDNSIPTDNYSSSTTPPSVDSITPLSTDSNAPPALPPRRN